MKAGVFLIRQRIFYDGALLITIIHENLDSGIENRYFEEVEEIGSVEMRFIEEYIDEIGEISYDEVLQGFICNQHKKNPYYSFSTYFREFIKEEKELIKNNQLTIDLLEFKHICHLVKEKTGFDLEANPYSISNTLVFSPTRISCRCFEFKGEIDGIEVNGLNAECITLIKLKFNDLVRETYVIHGEKCKVLPKHEWISLDVEVYDKGRIVFASYDLSLMKRINISMGVVSKQKEVQLKTSTKKINVKSISNMPISVGNSTDSKLTNYLEFEQNLKRVLESDERKDLYFLGKNEAEKAFDIFENIADYDCDELWIFDPYFINYSISGGINKLRDILKILIKNQSVKKYIVFESNENENAHQLDDFISKIFDDEMKNIRKVFGNLNLEFSGTSEHFHDRFFFFKKANQITGYIIGTSLNSFGENYSTLVKLKSKDAELILNKMNLEIVKNKINQNAIL